MTIKRTVLAACALWGCVDSDDVAPDLDTTAQEGVFDKGLLWTKDDLVVCWEDSAFDDPSTPDVVGDDVNQAERGYVQAVVENNWERHSRLELLGWGRCSQTVNPDIRIGNSRTSYPYSHIGDSSLNFAPSMLLNLKCSVPAECIDLGGQNPPPDDGHLAMCNGFLVNGAPPPSPKVCIETIALHEFGHALGLRHEHAHPDSSCAHQEPLDHWDTQWNTWHDGEAVGPFDPQSIMSYCVSNVAMRGTTTPSISPGNITAINTLYPSPPLLYAQANLGGGSLAIGPGTHAVTGHAAQTRSLSVIPGYVVTLCNTSTCHTVGSGVHTSLPTGLSGNVTTITVKTHAVGYTDSGFRGTSADYAPGKYLAVNGTLKLPNDTLSSFHVPHGMRMRVCVHEGTAPSYTGVTCLQNTGSVSNDDFPQVTLPSSLDNNTSFVEVTSFVQMYDGYGFRGGEKGGFFPGTWKTSAGWNFTNVRSWIVPQDLELTVCTGEGTGSGSGCQIVKSGDIPAGLFNLIKLIKVRILPTAPPPCRTC